MWAWIPGYKGLYQVSTDGRVRSLHRKVPQMLKPGRRADGRLQVSLTKDGTASTQKVHLLVARTFHGPCPDGMEARHLNGDHTDNRASNLRWGTKSENMFDRVAHGHHEKTLRERCPHGHLLAHPNLVISKLPHRNCRACGIGRAAHQRNTSVDTQSESDLQYQRIMEKEPRK